MLQNLLLCCKLFNQSDTRTGRLSKQNNQSPNLGVTCLMDGHSHPILNSLDLSDCQCPLSQIEERSALHHLGLIEGGGVGEFLGASKGFMFYHFLKTS